jgi:hypothetical protein
MLWEGVQVIYYIHKSLECLTLCGITLVVVEPVESRDLCFKKSSVRDGTPCVVEEDRRYLKCKVLYLGGPLLWL